MDVIKIVLVIAISLLASRTEANFCSDVIPGLIEISEQEKDDFCDKSKSNENSGCPKFNVQCSSFAECIDEILADAEWDDCDQKCRFKVEVKNNNKVKLEAKCDDDCDKDSASWEVGDCSVKNAFNHLDDSKKCYHCDEPATIDRICNGESHACAETETTKPTTAPTTETPGCSYGSPLVSHTETEKLCTTIPSKSSQELNDGSIVCPKFNVKCESLEECMVLVLEDAEWDVCDEGEQCRVKVDDKGEVKYESKCEDNCKEDSGSWETDDCSIENAFSSDTEEGKCYRCKAPDTFKSVCGDCDTETTAAPKPTTPPPTETSECSDGSPLVSDAETEEFCKNSATKSSQELNDGSIACPKFNVECESLEECMELVLKDAEWDVCDEGEQCRVKVDDKGDAVKYESKCEDNCKEDSGSWETDDCSIENAFSSDTEEGKCYRCKAPDTFKSICVDKCPQKTTESKPTDASEMCEVTTPEQGEPIEFVDSARDFCSSVNMDQDGDKIVCLDAKLNNCEFSEGENCVEMVIGESNSQNNGWVICDDGDVCEKKIDIVGNTAKVKFDSQCRSQSSCETRRNGRQDDWIPDNLCYMKSYQEWHEEDDYDRCYMCDQNTVRDLCSKEEITGIKKTQKCPTSTQGESNEMTDDSGETTETPSDTSESDSETDSNSDETTGSPSESNSEGDSDSDETAGSPSDTSESNSEGDSDSDETTGSPSDTSESNSQGDSDSDETAGSPSDTSESNSQGDSESDETTGSPSDTSESNSEGDSDSDETTGSPSDTSESNNEEGSDSNETTENPDDTTENNGEETTDSNEATENPDDTTGGSGATDSPGDTTGGSGATDSPDDTTGGSGATDSPDDTTGGSGATDSPDDTTGGSGATDSPDDTTGGSGATDSPDDTTGGSGATDSPDDTTGGSGATDSPDDTTGGSGATDSPDDTTGGSGATDNPDDNTGGSGATDHPDDTTGGSGATDSPDDTTGGSGATDSLDDTTGGSGATDNPDDNTGGSGATDNPDDTTGGSGATDSPDDTTGGSGATDSPDDTTGGSGATDNPNGNGESSNPTDDPSDRSTTTLASTTPYDDTIPEQCGPDNMGSYTAWAEWGECNCETNVRERVNRCCRDPCTGEISRRQQSSCTAEGCACYTDTVKVVQCKTCEDKASIDECLVDGCWATCDGDEICLTKIENNTLSGSFTVNRECSTATACRQVQRESNDYNAENAGSGLTKHAICDLGEIEIGYRCNAENQCAQWDLLTDNAAIQALPMQFMLLAAFLSLLWIVG